MAPCWDGLATLLEIESHGTAVASMIGGANVGIAPDASLVSLLGNCRDRHGRQG